MSIKVLTHSEKFNFAYGRGRCRSGNLIFLWTGQEMCISLCRSGNRRSDKGHSGNRRSDKRRTKKLFTKVCLHESMTINDPQRIRRSCHLWISKFGLFQGFWPILQFIPPQSYSDSFGTGAHVKCHFQILGRKAAPCVRWALRSFWRLSRHCRTSWTLCWTLRWRRPTWTTGWSTARSCSSSEISSVCSLATTMESSICSVRIEKFLLQPVLQSRFTFRSLVVLG